MRFSDSLVISDIDLNAYKTTFNLFRMNLIRILISKKILNHAILKKIMLIYDS
jgi:hypothetical protein